MEAFVKVAVVVMVVLVIPGFFALLLVSSAYHKLKALRTALQVARAQVREIQPHGAEDELACARQKLAEATADYDRARGAFPNNFVAALFRFPPAGTVVEGVGASKR